MVKNNENTMQIFKYSRFFDLLNDTVLLCQLNEDGIPDTFLEVNEVALKKLGYTFEELSNMSFIDILSRDSLAQIPAIVKKLQQSPRNTLELLFFSKCGKKIPLSLDTKLIDMDNKQVLLCIEKEDILIDAENNLERKQKLEETISEIYQKFLRVKNIDENIQKSLEDIGNLAGVGRSYLFQVNKDSNTMRNTHEWCAEGVEPQIDNLQDIPCDDYQWWFKELREKNEIQIDDVSKLPKEAKKEKEILLKQSIKSLLVLPIMNNNEIIGYVGFDNIWETGKFSKDNIFLLRLFSGILSYAFKVKYDNESHIAKNTRLQNQKKVLAKITTSCYSCMKNLKESLDFITELVCETLNVKSARIGIIDRDESTLRFGSLYDIEQNAHLSTASLKMDIDYLSEIFKEDRIKILKGLEKKALFPFLKINTNSMITGAFTFNSEMKGLLICESSEKDRNWHEDEQEFCASVSQLLTQIFAQLEKRKIERNLKISEKRFRRLVENAEDLIYRMNLLPHISFEYVSPSAIKVTGYRPEEFYDDPYLLFKIIYPDDLHLINQTNEDFSGKSVNMRVVKKDGSVSWVELRAVQIKNSDDEIIAMEGIFRDATERIEAENALRISEQRFKSIFDNTSVGITVHDVNEKLITANKAMADFLSYPEHELINHYYEELIYPEDLEKERMLLKELHTGKRESYLSEKRYLRKDGGIVWGRTNVSVSRDENGEPLNFIAVTENITPFKTAQNELSASLEKLQRAFTDMVETVGMTVEMKDSCTADHQHRVSLLAQAIAKEMGLDEDKIKGIEIAAGLHDIGKVSVPAEFLNKPAKLSPMEFDMVKEHSRIGYEVLKGRDFPWPVADMVLQHHERMDGSGYPSGLKGDEILIEARIIAVADVVESMSSHRPYRPPLGTEKALEEICRGSGTLYDSCVVEACKKAFENGFEF